MRYRQGCPGPAGHRCWRSWPAVFEPRSGARRGTRRPSPARRRGTSVRIGGADLLDRRGRHVEPGGRDQARSAAGAPQRRCARSRRASGPPTSASRIRRCVASLIWSVARKCRRDLHAEAIRGRRAARSLLSLQPVSRVGMLSQTVDTSPVRAGHAMEVTEIRLGTGSTLSMTAPPQAIEIYVDADACPVKPEIYRVAERHRRQGLRGGEQLHATCRSDPLIERVLVGAGFDAADDWIAERARRGAIVITADIPLASRCVKAGADVIGPTGTPVHGSLHRHGARHPQPDGGSARHGRRYRRAEAVFAKGPLGIPVRARRGDRQAQAGGICFSRALNAGIVSGVSGPICLWRMVPSGPTMKVSGTP